MTVFHLPDLGEGLVEAEIVQWHVAPGDHVVADQPLLAVETEKAVVEIPSPQSGHVTKLLANVGQHVKVGAPLLTFEEGPHAETGTVMGELEAPASKRQDAAPIEGNVSVRATPAVRARARKLGVDLARIVPSGPNGAVTIADVENAASQTSSSTGEMLRGARRSMALNMAHAWREVAHASLHDTADVERWSRGMDVTSRLIRAVVAGCASEPIMNATFDAGSLSLRHNPEIDLGLAIDSPDGLFVPVLRGVTQSSPEQWRGRIESAKKAVRERSLTPADLRAPTITLSNFGTIAGRHAALIVMPPQVAIVGAGRIAEHAVPRGGGFAFHRTMPISVTFDHRAISGGQAARFLRALLADLEKPQ